MLEQHSSSTVLSVSVIIRTEISNSTVDHNTCMYGYLHVFTLMVFRIMLRPLYHYQVYLNTIKISGEMIAVMLPSNIFHI
jgi:hypothetical protein